MFKGISYIVGCTSALNARKYEVIKTAITTSVFAQAPSPPIRTEPNYSLLINVQRTYNPSAWEDGIFPSYASDTSQAHPHWGCGRPRPHIWPAKHGPTCKNRFFTSYALNARKYEVIKTKVCSCHFLSFLFFSVILFGVLELLLYFCSRNSIENEPWIVVPGSFFSLLFLFYVLSDFFGMVRNRVQGML